MKRLSLAACVLLLLAPPAIAQTTSISGTVVDQSGAVVPGATVTVTGAGTTQTAVTGAKGEYSVQVSPGTYRVTVTLAGFEPAVRQNVAVSSGNVEVPSISLTVGRLGETVVVSASKVETTLIRAPATMSVISSERIAVLPAQNYADLLRTVPGVNVIQMSARDINLTSRQATGTISNTQLALLDGRSVYLDFFGLILWDFIPTNPDEIKQIEVVRGPASAVWGANALTGVVNIITKTPRESPKASVTFSAGGFSRDAGSGVDKGMGGIFGVNASVSQAPNDRWSYRFSGGYFNSDPYPRPTGQIPLIPDPRDPTLRVGGARYPSDSTGPLGTAFENRGTSQPKFDARIDQELSGGARMSYAAGIAGTEGIIYTGLGPFDIQSGSRLGYVRAGYGKGPLKVNFFVNLLDAEAPNLLLPDPRTGGPLQLDFKTQTYDFEIGDSIPVGTHNVFTFGGNVRRNNFDISIAPAGEDRSEFGAYIQDEIFFEKFRFVLGGRVDKFGNIDNAVFSPRVSALFQPQRDHSVRVSFNRAFRSPSTINNWLDASIVSPTDLSGLAPLLPPALQPLVRTPFPLVVRAVGSELPIGTTPQPALQEESLTAYEVAYTGTIQDRTTVGFAFYVNDFDNNVNFSQLPPSLDPYTATNPPPGWPLPPAILAQLAQLRIFLPRTAFTYLNLGPIRNKGIELSVDHRVDDSVSAFANYSWQAEPTILDDPDPFPLIELPLPATNRFNAGVTYNGPRFLGSGTVNYADGAFWADVLSSPFHGFTDSYTMVNGAFGVKWMDGRLTTSVKSTNLLNQDIQQHVFGDILKRSVVAEVKLTVR